MGRDQHCIGCFFFMVSEDKGRWKQQKLGNLRLRVGISRFSAQWHQFLCMLGIDSQSEFVITATMMMMMIVMRMTMSPVTLERRSHSSSLLFSSRMPLCPSLIARPLLLPEQIVNENFLLCRRQGHMHLLSASTKSVSNGCD